MTRPLISLIVLALAVAAVASSGAATSAPACKASQLSGTFKAVPGSAGAGNIVYKLVVKNISTKACSITGLPKGGLLDKTGKVQETPVLAAAAGMMAIFKTLTHGKTASATARFSPDIPGKG